jgi:periplasmic copper chaperone A
MRSLRLPTGPIPSFARVLAGALLSCASIAACAQSPLVRVERPWARATVQGQDATGAYMTLIAREPLTLLGADTPAAGIVEIHQMKMVGDVMRMSAAETLPLKPGEPLQFAPNGYHFMLMDLKAPFRIGSTIAMTLRLRDAKGAARTVEVSVPVALVPPQAGTR